LVVTWAAWLVSARVALYELAESARLEVEDAAHPVAAPVGGRVIATRLAIGRAVSEGEPLVVLDAECPRHLIREKRARCTALAERLESLRREIQAERAALAAQQAERATAVAAAQAEVAEAEARARLAGLQLVRLETLRGRRAVSAEEYQRGQAEAEACRAAL